MNTITLLYDGTEQTIQAWGFDMPKRTRKSRTAGIFKLIMPNGDPAAAALIPFEAQVKIYANRTGAGTAWSGGVCIFAGRRTDRPSQTSGDSRDVLMVFSDAWYDLEKTPYQQLWYKRNAGDTSPNTGYYTRIYLWHDYSTGGLLSSDAQLAEIINFAATECGVLIQAGRIDPIQNYPVYPTKALSCADAINLVVRSMPDVTTSIDYTTTPPTLNIRQRAQLGSITLPYNTSDLAGTRRHETLSIKDRPDLQAPSIILQYQTNNTVDGESFTAFSADSYGTDSTGFSLRDIVAPLDMRGSKITYLAGQLTAAACNPASNAFWTTHKPDLNDATITPNGSGGTDFVVNPAVNDGSDFCITVTDTSGSPVSLDAYPNELESNGHYAPWMKSGSTQINVKEVVVTAYLKYYSKDSAGIVKNHDLSSHAVSVRLKLTNSAVGTVSYLSQNVTDPGETAPIFLAYAIWCSINNVVPNLVDGYYVPPESVPALDSPSNLQWEGTHVVRENNLNTLIANDVTLNLTADPATGNAPWTGMNATIYEIEEDYFECTTTIQFGPHKNLTAEQFFDQTMLWRFRFVFDPPSMRSTGSDSSTTGPSISTDSKVQNTNHSATPSYQQFSAIGPVVDGIQPAVQLQPTTNGGQLLIQDYDSFGDEDEGSMTIRIAKGDINPDVVNAAPVDGLPIVCLRLTNGCDNSGLSGTAYFVRSDWET